MNLNELLSQLERQVALKKEKANVAFQKGLSELGTDILKEAYDTEVLLNDIRKVNADVVFFEQEYLKLLIQEMIIERLPDFTLFFRKSSIDGLVKLAVSDALDVFMRDHLQKKLIRITSKAPVTEAIEG